MLTAQANRLREMAYTVERVKNDAVGKLSLSGSITLATAARDMRDAADTISYLCRTCNDLQRDNAKLKELVRDMWRDGMCECDERGACTECEYGYHERMREAGIEVGDA